MVQGLLSPFRQVFNTLSTLKLFKGQEVVSTLFDPSTPNTL